MKRILCTSIVLVMLLTACSAPVQQIPPSTESSGGYIYGVYELDFDISFFGKSDISIVIDSDILLRL